MELHHKKPKAKGGSDAYNNLIFTTKEVHKLIHAVNEITIQISCGTKSREGTTE